MTTAPASDSDIVAPPATTTAPLLAPTTSALQRLLRCVKQDLTATKEECHRRGATEIYEHKGAFLRVGGFYFGFY